jgi:hypothetical protein
MNDDFEFIERLQSLVVKPKSIDEATYTRAYALLKIYKEVLWGLEESIEELDRQSRKLLGEDLSFAIEILDKFDYRMNKDRFDDEIYDKVELKNLVMLIARALIKVKNFPNHGERYFSILEKNFLLKYSYTEDEMLENLEVSKTTYYKYRKEAIKLMGYCLWNMILPGESLYLKQKVM